MRRYLLDTNIASFIIRGANPELAHRISQLAPSALCISAVTEGELLFGLARKPGATRLAAVVEAFLARMQVLDWDRVAARSYATLRAELEMAGRGVRNLDLMIAAHAKAEQLVLATNDLALARLPGVKVEHWA